LSGTGSDSLGKPLPEMCDKIGFAKSNHLSLHQMPKYRHVAEQPMCGRFSLTFPSGELREYFQLDRDLSLTPRYNIAPSQDVAVIRREDDGRVLRELHWGLIPFWAKDRKIGYRTLNARAETAHKSPSFRAAFRSRRCLVPADGFYEWDKAGGTRQPYFIHLADNKPMAFEGLWERWQDKEQNTASITTGNNVSIPP
jgi:putative SOS response-associated peptidase YedK